VCWSAAHAVPIESPAIVNRLLVEHLTEVTRLVALYRSEGRT
jgi:hypothetical protein